MEEQVVELLEVVKQTAPEAWRALVRHTIVRNWSLVGVGVTLALIGSAIGGVMYNVHLSDYPRDLNGARGLLLVCSGLGLVVGLMCLLASLPGLLAPEGETIRLLMRSAGG